MHLSHPAPSQAKQCRGSSIGEAPRVGKPTDGRSCLAYVDSLPPFGLLSPVDSVSIERLAALITSAILAGRPGYRADDFVDAGRLSDLRDDIAQAYALGRGRRRCIGVLYDLRAMPKVRRGH